MKCDDCGGPLRVVESYSDGETFHRIRQCIDPECAWKCNTQEKFVEEVYSPIYLGKKIRRAKRKAES